MKKTNFGVLKICAVVFAVAVIFFAGCTNKIAKENATTEPSTAPGITLETVTTEVVEVVTNESGETITDASGEAVTSVVEKVVESTPQVDNVKNWTDQEILYAYKKVVDKVKVDKPTYYAVDYQPLANKDALSADVVNVFDKYFYKGDGHESLVAESIVDTRMLETKEYAYSHDGSGTHERKRPDEIIAGEPQNTKWFAVSRSQYGCLLTDATKLKDLTVETLPDGNIKIVLYLPTETSPGNIKDDKNKDKMTSIHSGIMDVSELDTILTFGPVIFGPTFKSRDASCVFHDSTSTLIYNPKTNQCVSLYQIAKISLTVSGKLKGVDLSGTTLEINAIYDYYKFDWNSVK